MIPLENTPPSSSSESEREQPPSQEIPKDIPLAVEKKKSVGVEEALLSQEAEEKNLKVQTPQEYQAFLKEWMANFSLKKEEKIPPLRLLSSLSLEEFYLRQQQGYETFCFPESLRPEYFIEIRIPSPSQILYEKHSDKPHLFARIQNFCLKEEMPLFQRFKAEIGSRPDLYHPRDGLLLIVNIPPASLQSYFQFKQYLALQAFQLRFSDVRLFVGTLKKTTFGQEVLLINGILTQEGKKLYPQDPERTLLQFP